MSPDSFEITRGGVTERLMVTVLKTVFASANVGSNPTPSANILQLPAISCWLALCRLRR